MRLIDVAFLPGSPALMHTHTQTHTHTHLNMLGNRHNCHTCVACFLHPPHSQSPVLSNAHVQNKPSPAGRLIICGHTSPTKRVMLIFAEGVDVHTNEIPIVFHIHSEQTHTSKNTHMCAAIAPPSPCHETQFHFAPQPIYWQPSVRVVNTRMLCVIIFATFFGHTRRARTRASAL